MTDLTVDRLAKALDTPENRELARDLANDVGNTFSDALRNVACGMPTTGLAVVSALAIVARLRKEVETFAVKSLVEAGDPEEDRALVAEAVELIFASLCAEPMVDMGSGPYPEFDGLGAFVMVLR